MSDAAVRMPEKDSPNQDFRALDPQLPLLSAKAAVQLDNLRLKMAGQFASEPRIDAIQALVQRLTGALDAVTSSKALFDPITETVLSSALAQSHHDQMTKQKDFRLAADELTKLLQRLEKNQATSQEELASWRDFCIAVSTLSASKQQSIYGTRPHHAHRR